MKNIKSIVISILFFMIVILLVSCSGKEEQYTKDDLYYDIYSIYLTGSFYFIKEGRVPDGYIESLKNSWNKNIRNKKYKRLLINTSNKKNIDTIFDHDDEPNISKIIQTMFISSNKEIYLENFSQDAAYYHIYLFYKWKGEEKIANEFYSKINGRLREEIEVNVERANAIFSLIDQMGYIDTVFDHNPTGLELQECQIYFKTKKRYLFAFFDDMEHIYNDLYYLYKYRGDIELSEKYYSMVSEEWRVELENKTRLQYDEGPCCISIPIPKK